MLPKYDENKGIGGYLHEEAIKSKELIFGNEWEVRIYNIGKGRLILVPHKNINASGKKSIKNFISKVIN